MAVTSKYGKHCWLGRMPVTRWLGSCAL